jgi:hypothetical protein
VAYSLILCGYLILLSLPAGLLLEGLVDKRTPVSSGSEA